MSGLWEFREMEDDSCLCLRTCKDKIRFHEYFEAAQFDLTQKKVGFHGQATTFLSVVRIYRNHFIYLSTENH
uniref:Uncharacterized protein n=1 Tax=Solanum lycopersicum TaxID=4081 RepID=A0A3Q7F3W0_SOLLC